jgi:hypothetical protein
MTLDAMFSEIPGVDYFLDNIVITSSEDSMFVPLVFLILIIDELMIICLVLGIVGILEVLL